MITVSPLMKRMAKIIALGIFSYLGCFVLIEYIQPLVQDVMA